MVQSRTIAKLLAVIGTAIAAMALLASVASAAEPKEGYKQFAGCPTKAESSKVTTCFRAEIYAGHFQMGSKDVPIEKPITITGGLGPFTELIYNSQGGMPPVKQKVPGGVIGLTGLTWLFEFLGSEALTLYAATELAGTAFPILEPNILPIKVHLINSVLGNNCYVGSTASPIVLHQTTGTTAPPPPNKPITGHEPESAVFDPSTEILRLNKGEFVDNSFSAPGASGCTLTLFGFIPISINGLVNSQSGLPAAAGTNETRQNFNAEIVERGLVY